MTHPHRANPFDRRDLRVLSEPDRPSDVAPWRPSYGGGLIAEWTYMRPGCDCAVVVHPRRMYVTRGGQIPVVRGDGTRPVIPVGNIPEGHEYTALRALMAFAEGLHAALSQGAAGRAA